MEEVKRSFNKIWYSELLSSILLCVIGGLLIARPDQIITLIATIIGLAIVVLGIFGILRYFKNKGQAFNFDLMYGLICIVSGALIITNPKVIASFLPIMLGIWMIGNSIIKIQYSMTLKEYESSKWIPNMIISILTLACGILFVFNPFKGAKVITQILGITLVIYAIIDIINSVLLKKNIKIYFKQDDDNVKEASYEEIVPTSKTETKKTKKKNTKKNKM